MRKRLVIVLAVAAVGYEVVSVVINSFTPGPGGATSSSYATSSDGLAAYAEVLQRTGRRVTQLRGKLGDAQLEPAQTVIALDPNRLTSADTDKLKTFVNAGGRLLAGGTIPGRWLKELLQNPPSWSSAGLPEATSISGSADIRGVSRVVSAGEGSFTSSGQTTPALGGGGGAALVATARLGRGQIALLADASPLQNAYIGRADNAALGDRLAGTQGRSVAFLEGIHGYGTGTGLAGLPARWKWALIGMLLVAATLIAARFRRLGDPEPAPSSPVPARRAHVEALALALERTRQPPVAAAPVVGHARELVLRRTMLGPDADGDAIISAAQGLGLDEAEARAIAGGVESGTEGDLLAAGRALARLI
jgi:Domain of unknown function (DUF4350)